MFFLDSYLGYCSTLFFFMLPYPVRNYRCVDILEIISYISLPCNVVYVSHFVQGRDETR